jgi:hypothetical protein
MLYNRTGYKCTCTQCTLHLAQLVFFGGFIKLLKEKTHENIHLKESTERDRTGDDALLRCHRVLPLQHSRPRRQHSRGIFPLTR